MKKINYDKETDALLIELSDEPIAYADQESDVILHYSQENQLVLVEILDFCHLQDKCLGIIPIESSSKLDKLVNRPDVIVGDPEDLVQITWDLR
ncbi:MAG: DUF2283 domain-containing protein [Cyanobacteria bacterium RI_101]|jgi:uncharacterized protein YuzE|nr:DUF2283 domain-containing protein [Cyanobacteria bacterium RI_101]